MKRIIFTLLVAIMFIQLLPAQEVEKPTSWKAYLLSEMQGMVEGGKKLGGEVIDQLKVQVPDLVNQLLWWEGVQSVLFCLIGVIVLTTGITANVRIGNKVRSQDLDYEWVPIRWGILVLSVVIGAVVIFENLTWLKILIAPKLFLFQYFAEYIK